MIVPAQSQNLQVKPRWVAPVGVMESVVAYNCRKYGMPRPILNMPMWEGAGNQAIDLSGYGGHGVFDQNAAQTPPYWDGGIHGAEIELGGTGNAAWVQISDHDIFDASVITLEFYGRFDTPTNDGYPVAKRDGGSRQWNLYLASGSGYPRLFAGATNIEAAISIKDGNYHHLVGVINGSNSKLYVDGVEKGSGTLPSIVPIASDVYIGVRGDGAGGGLYPFAGSSVFARIYDTALSAAQAKFLYDNPYFMYRMPEELYGYTAAAPPTGNPFWYYNMIRRRNQQ